MSLQQAATAFLQMQPANETHQDDMTQAAKIMACFGGSFICCALCLFCLPIITISLIVYCCCCKGTKPHPQIVVMGQPGQQQPTYGATPSEEVFIKSGKSRAQKK